LISTQVEPVVEEGGGGHDGHDHDDHGHGHGPYEWIGVFELADGEPYTWTADKVGEKYADATMKLNIVELEGFEDGDDYDAAVDAVRASAAVHVVVAGRRRKASALTTWPDATAST